MTENPSDAALPASPREETPVVKPTIWSPKIEGQLDGFMDPEASAVMRAQQAARARAVGILLVALCVLFFAVTIVKISLQ